MSTLLRIPYRYVVPGYRRCLATTSSPTTSQPPRTDFAKSLDKGPSFHDFLSVDSSERVVLGNAKGWAYPPYIHKCL